MLKNAAVIILDEAMSALDIKSEAIIQEELDKFMRGRTVFAIAHRASTIVRMDRTVLLKDGQIVEVDRAEWLATQ